MGISGLLLSSRYTVMPCKTTTTPERMEIMREIVEIGEDAYRQLTDRTEGFLDYFYEATPINEIALMNIGSRPSHRKKGDRSKTSVRAIGWVFGWAQSRHTLPAWYGIGSALEKWIGGDNSRLQTLQEVGLDYIEVGQPATTLSGGEAQRVKLASELSHKATGRTLYILDEPTTGLHLHDIDKLLKVLHALVDQGNTVLVIEHHLDVIKTADYVLDLGPEGGAKGGQVVAAGTPEVVARNRASYTGQYLQPLLEQPLPEFTRPVIA